jgi:hypothetical protein
MTFYTALLVLVIAACIAYLVVFHRGLSLRDLAIQLLLTFLGTFVGVLASLETSRRLADEELTSVVVDQTQIALSQLQSAKLGIDNEDEAYVDRRIDMAIPALKRLANLPGAHRVLGLDAVNNIDDVIYYAEQVVESDRRDAFHSHIMDLWRRLAIGFAHASGDEKLARCGTAKFRDCDFEVEAYLKTLLAGVGKKPVSAAPIDP